MFRTELDEIQSRLKTAIQKHQCLVTKLQIQPQDVGVKQQLQIIQIEIMKMSKKQKSVVQNLRKDLIDRQIRDIKLQDSQVDVLENSSNNNQDEACTSKSPLRIPQYPSISDKNSHNSNVNTNNDTTSKIKCTPVTPENDVKLKQHKSMPVTAENHVKLRQQSCDKAWDLKKKLDFMACIDLVPPDSVKDTPGKRSERKRKSTNNPNFAYGFELERRPRLSNMLASEYFGAKKSKCKTSVARTDTISTSSSTPTSPPSPAVCDNHTDTKENTPNERLCDVCGLCGQMIVCDTCTHCFHLLCLVPPLHCLPVGRWHCPSCQEVSNNSGTSSLSAVNSYISIKTGKEEEKRKLLKRSTELLQEKTHLENRTKQLNELLTRQGVRKQDLIDINLKAKQSVENLKNFVKIIQSS